MAGAWRERMRIDLSEVKQKRRVKPRQPRLTGMEPATRSKNYRLGELFAGAGGMALGAKQVPAYKKHRFEQAWMNDIEAEACITFYINLPIDVDGIYCGDVQDLHFNEMPRVDGLAFGFPCNDFSVVGKRPGRAGRYGKLYQWAAEALVHFQPLFFIAENVGGLKVKGNDDYDVVTASFRDAGYDLFPHKYNFAEYGVPQERKRIIIVGFRKDLGIGQEGFTHPAPTHKNKMVTAEEALADIPKNPKKAPNQELTRQSDRVVERLKHIKPGQNAFTAEMPDHLRIKMNSNAQISLIYKKLRPDKPSYTITGSGGGGTYVYHWKYNRALTNRERARLQSFPDQFEFHGSKGSVRKQIGMAVPPVGAKVIFSAVLRTLVDNNVESQCCTGSSELWS